MDMLAIAEGEGLHTRSQSLETAARFLGCDQSEIIRRPAADFKHESEVIKNLRDPARLYNWEGEWIEYCKRADGGEGNDKLEK